MPFNMICRLLFLISIVLSFAASFNIDFQDGELLSNFGAELNSVVLASGPQNGLDESAKVATAPPYTVEDSEAFLVQSNNDECPYDPAQSPRKTKSKRESRFCDPSTRNSVLGSGHDPSKKDPQENRENNKKDSQDTAQPIRGSQDSDCAAMPSAPSPVCAVVTGDYIQLHIVYPMTGLLTGWWYLLYARTGSYTPLYHFQTRACAIIFPIARMLGCHLTPHTILAPPACYREVGEIFFCCAIVYHVSVPVSLLGRGGVFGIPFADFDKNANNNLRYPIVSSQHNPFCPPTFYRFKGELQIYTIFGVKRVLTKRRF